MKILFVYPSWTGEYGMIAHFARRAGVFPPLNLALLAAIANKTGHEARIIDAEVECLRLEKVMERAKEFNPDIIACTGKSPFFHLSKNLLMAVKQQMPHVKTMIGGQHITIMEEKVFDKAFDFGIIGECENTFGEFLNRLQSGSDFSDIKGIMYWEGDEIKYTGKNTYLRDLDNLPFPARHLLPYKKYRMGTLKGRLGFTSIQTIRGCPWKCFEENTRIITGFGHKSKKAKDVNPGDKLLAFDEKTGEIVETNVDVVMSRTVDEIMKITFSDETFVLVTGEHPFYVKKQWVEAKNLKVGDEIYSITQHDKINRNPNRREKQRIKFQENNPMFDNLVSEKVGNTISLQFKNGERINNFKNPDWVKKYKPYSKNPDNKEKNFKSFSERMKKNNPMFNRNTIEKKVKTYEARVNSGETSYHMCTQKYWDSLKKPKNKAEEKFHSILKSEFGDRFEFCGDGKKRIGRFAPDFIDKYDKKIIEFNGCYFHDCPICHPNKKDGSKQDQKFKYLEKCGYKIKVVWDHEMKDRERLMSDLRHFAYNGKKIIKIENINKSYKVVNFSCSPYQNYFANWVLSHNCIFCASEKLQTTNIGKRSPKSVLEEIEQVVKDFGVRHFWVVDDVLTLDKPHIQEICHGIIDRKLKITFEGSTRANLLDEPLVILLKNAGLIRLSFGLETVDTEMRKTMNKKVPLEHYIKSNALLDKHGVEALNSVMLGLPGETPATIKKTLDFLRNEKHVKQANFAIAIPYPGTEFHEIAKRGTEGVTLTTTDFSNYRRYGTAVTIVNGMTPEDLIEYQNEGFVSIYSAPWRWKPMMRKHGLIGGVLMLLRVFKLMVRKKRLRHSEIGLVGLQ